jgi:hypothetical protein
MTKEGSVIYWNEGKKFGVVESREPWKGGFKLTKYFLHQSRIVFMTEEPQLGSFVRFEVRDIETPGLTTPSGREVLADAVNVEVYRSDHEQALIADKGGVL